MKVKYRWVKTTKNYQKFIPTKVPDGTIFEPVYLPLTETRKEIELEVVETKEDSSL